MQFAKSLLLNCTLIPLVCAAMSAQKAATSSIPAVVPRLVNFFGKAVDDQGKPITGIAGITFSIYSEQYEGAPLWMETQNVNADAKGNYTVQLGAMSTEGLPLDVFTSGEARWLGVRVNGGEEQARVLLLSVPYALKAADAQTLGGLPPSAFALAGSASASAPPSTVSPSKSRMAASGNANTPSPLTTTGSGTKGNIPIWTSSTSLGNSAFFQTGTGASAKVGLGTTTPGAPLDVHGLINSSAGFNLGGKSFAFGSYTTGNAFLGFAGNIKTTGDLNTAVGGSALNSNTTGYDNTAVGAGALYSNTTGYENTAVGNAALGSNTGIYNTAVGALALYANAGYYDTATGYGALQSNTTANNNTAIGYEALHSNTTGYFETAVGASALYSNIGNPAGTEAYSNTAVGYEALYSNTTGNSNTAVGQAALFGNTTGSDLTCIGNACAAANALRNATAIGAHAVVEQSNSLVLGGTGDHAVEVGIGTTKPSNILTVGRGAGHPVSDSWETYSSRRWKTNIRPLENALSKVEQLRGVSYDLKDSGKHEIGVIAEEVGQVVPEVVSYEKNGKDAQGVDYSRLTALLIEAVKQQQTQIATQQRQIALQQSQIRKQQRLAVTQKQEIAGLRLKVGALEVSLRTFGHGDTPSVLASQVKTGEIAEAVTH